MKRLRLLVSGKVQGVFFRASTAEEARRLGVQGWVRNLSDGRVEIVAEGTAEALDALEGWARQGPRGAVVERVEREVSEGRGEFHNFRITG